MSELDEAALERLDGELRRPFVTPPTMLSRPTADVSGYERRLHRMRLLGYDPLPPPLPPCRPTRPT